MKSIDKEIEILIDNEFTKFTLSRVYQTAWTPIINKEDLNCRHKNENEVDVLAIGVYHYDLQRETSEDMKVNENLKNQCWK